MYLDATCIFVNFLQVHVHVSVAMLCWLYKQDALNNDKSVPKLVICAKISKFKEAKPHPKFDFSIGLTEQETTLDRMARVESRKF